MTNCTVANKDKVQTKYFGLRPVKSKEKQALKCCKMAANGDCFFLSIAYQLYNVKADSKEHHERALELRKSVVTYIKDANNFTNFLHDLKNRAKYGKNTEDSKITESCLNFLDVHLSKSGTFAGMESLKAISQIENVNLVVINEDGTAYLPNHFNPEAKKSLLLLFGSSNGKSCKNNSERLHYDSVVTIHKEKIAHISKEINEAENHHDKFVKEAANRSEIIIE